MGIGVGWGILRLWLRPKWIKKKFIKFWQRCPLFCQGVWLAEEGGEGVGQEAACQHAQVKSAEKKKEAETLRWRWRGRRLAGGGVEVGEYCWKQLAKQFNDEWWSIANFLESVGQGGVQAGWATMRPGTHWGICTWLVSQLSSAEARGGGLRQRFSIENQFITM